MQKNKLYLGPDCLRNYRSYLQKTDRQVLSWYEVPLYSDSYFRGEINEGIEPYQILNCISLNNSDAELPSLILRVRRYRSAHEDLLSMTKTNVNSFCGGGEADEIASILSLEYGIRIQAGNWTRMSDTHDVLGKPIYSQWIDKPILLKSKIKKTLLPNLPNDICLDKLELLNSILSQPEDISSIIIRCTRLYQEALWIVDFNPHLAWLNLISSIETAANLWKNHEFTATERLKEFKPELLSTLNNITDVETVNSIAEMLTDYMGATKKFLGFIEKYHPQPPSIRPKLYRINWQKEELLKSLKTIYEWRSQCLHGGIPFPIPLCFPPEKYDDYYFEKPSGLAVQSMNGVWMSDDIPMHFHIFEYIVRNVLINWIKDFVK